MGLFTWWALVDQRMTVWTGLIGPTTAILMAVFVRPSFLLAYLLWIMTTRLMIAAVLGLLHGRFSFWWPLLLYYGQVSGALVKGWISFRTNRQKWTRQGIATGGAGGPWHARLQPAVSTGLHVAALVAFVYAVALMTRVLPAPDGGAVAAALRPEPPIAAPDAGAPAAGPDDWWVAPALAAAPAGGALRLPAGEVRIAAAVLAGPARTDRIAGAGAAATALTLAGAAAPDTAPALDAPRPCGTGPDACRLTGPDGRRWTIEDATLRPAAAAPGRAPEIRP
jgi:glycosyltransferase Alg8